MEILNILYDYSYKNKILDIDSINKICKLLIKEKNINESINFITNKNISRIDKYVLGEYDMKNTIYIYHDQIEKFINCNIFKKKYLSNDNLNNTEITMLKNMHIIETILHELEHFIQTNKVKDISDNTFEKIIYQYEYNFMFPNFDNYKSNIIKLYLDLIKKNYLEYMTYNISFMERMANINSKEQIINILKKYNNEFKNIYSIEKKYLEKYKLKNYLINVDGPTNLFLSKIGVIEDFKNHNYDELVNNMPLKDRYRYGFPITNREFKKKIRIF